MKNVYERKGQLLSQSWQSAQELPGISDPIENHATFCFDVIYQHHYSANAIHDDSSDVSNDSCNASSHCHIPREYHGIAHVSRVAVYVECFYCLLRDINPEIAALQPDDLHLLQIAALFHDAGREDDGVDRWDCDSAEMLYHYLIRIGVSKEKAVQFAEIIANKDQAIESDNQSGRQIFNRCVIQEDGSVIWEQEAPLQKKNVLTQLLHDADSLDIIRARPQFTLSYLDCYHIVSSHLEASRILSEFIIEARRLIAYQGDSYRQLDYQKKEKWSISACYHDTVQWISASSQFPYLNALRNNQLLRLPIPSSFNSNRLDPHYFSDENMEAAMRAGCFFVRGIDNFNSYTSKSAKDDSRGLETNAALEIRKMQRRLGNPTRTKKIETKLLKDGNPYRSATCAIGRGTALFSAVGFGMVDPQAESIKAINLKDADTGRGGKRHLSFQDRISDPKLHAQSISSQREAFIHAAVTGELSAYYAKEFPHIFYSEVIFFKLYETHCDCIVFTTESVMKPSVAGAAFLAAVYLQSLFLHQTGRLLPIFEYSGQATTLRRREVSENLLLDEWRKVIDVFFKNINTKNALNLLCSRSAQEGGLLNELHFRIFDMSWTAQEQEPLDQYYPSGLKQQISNYLSAKVQELERTLSPKVAAFFSDTAAFNHFLLRYSFCSDGNMSLVRRMQQHYFISGFKKYLTEAARTSISAFAKQYIRDADKYTMQGNIFFLFQMSQILEDHSLKQLIQQTGKRLIIQSLNKISMDFCQLRQYSEAIYFLPSLLELESDHEIQMLVQQYKTDFTERCTRIISNKDIANAALLASVFYHVRDESEQLLMCQVVIEVLHQCNFSLEFSRSSFPPVLESSSRNSEKLTDLQRNKLQDIYKELAKQLPGYGVRLFNSTAANVFFKDFSFVMDFLKCLYQDLQFKRSMWRDKYYLIPDCDYKPSFYCKPLYIVFSRIFSNDFSNESNRNDFMSLHEPLWRSFVEDTEQLDFWEMVFPLLEVFDFPALDDRLGAPSFVPSFVIDVLIEKLAKENVYWIHEDSMHFYNVLSDFVNLTSFTLNQCQAVYAILKTKAPREKVEWMVSVIEAKLQRLSPVVALPVNAAPSALFFPPVASQQHNVEHEELRIHGNAHVASTRAQ